MFTFCQREDSQPQNTWPCRWAYHQDASLSSSKSSFAIFGCASRPDIAPSVVRNLQPLPTLAYQAHDNLLVTKQPAFDLLPEEGTDSEESSSYALEKPLCYLLITIKAVDDRLGTNKRYSHTTSRPKANDSYTTASGQDVNKLELNPSDHHPRHPQRAPPTPASPPRAPPPQLHAPRRPRSAHRAVPQRRGEAPATPGGHQGPGRAL